MFRQVFQNGCYRAVFLFTARFSSSSSLISVLYQRTWSLHPASDNSVIATFGRAEGFPILFSGLLERFPLPFRIDINRFTDREEVCELRERDEGRGGGNGAEKP